MPRSESRLRVALPFGPGAPVLDIGHARADAELARRLARVASTFDPRVFASDRNPSGFDPAVPTMDPSASGFDSEVVAIDPTAAGGRVAGPDTIRLLLAPDEATFRRSSGGRFPDWGLAVAFPRRSCIVLRSPRLVRGDVQDPGRVLAHELVHVYLALFLGSAGDAAPRWFHEGLASLLAGEWGWSERFELTVALVGG